MSFLSRLLGGGRSATPSDVPAPHVFTFAQVLNQVWKTYSYRYDEALKNLPTNALAMRRDAYIRALLQERCLPTARRKWQLEVDNPKDPRQKEVKEALTIAVKSTKKLTRLRRYLLEAAWYGRYGSQGVWERDPQVKTDTGSPLWVFRRHKPVNGDKIQYQWDDTPAVMVNLTQKWPQESLIYGDRAPLLKLDRPEWRRQFIIHTHEVEDADYFEGEMAGAVHGVGLRSHIYWSWWMRDECLSWAMDFMQKVGTLGLLVFWYEAGNKEAKLKAEQNAKDASNRAAMVMPYINDGRNQPHGVDQIAPNTGGVEALQNMIAEYFEKHQERLVVGQAMSSGADKGDGLGGTGRADFAKDTKYQLLAYDAENLDETLTDDFVGVAKQLNFPWADFPVRFKSIVPDPEMETKMKGIIALWEKAPVKTDEAYEAFGVTRPEEGDETLGGMLSQTPPGGAPLGGLLGDGQGGDKPLGGLLAGGEPVADRPPATENEPEEYAWDESEHPRAEDGRFGDKPGEHGGKGTSHPAAEVPHDVKEAEEHIASLDDETREKLAKHYGELLAMLKKPVPKRLPKPATEVPADLLDRTKALMENAQDAGQDHVNASNAHADELKKLTKDQLKALAKAAGVEGVYPSSSKEETLLRIRNRMTAGHRAQVRARI